MNKSIISIFLVLSNGSVTYSEVRMFQHNNPNTIETYKTIKTSFKESLTFTGNHLVFSRKSCYDNFNTM